jgi:hypothetical protein
MLRTRNRSSTGEPEFVAVVAHGEIALYKIAEGSIKVKSTCLMITKELVLEFKPQVSRGVAAFPNDLHRIRGDRVGEPGKDDDILPGPAWVVGEGIIRLDVVGEGISHQGQQHVLMPPGLVVGHGV